MMPSRLRSVGNVVRRVRTRLRWPGGPFRGKPVRLVHCTYHKMGTVWLRRVLRDVAREFGMRLQTINDDPERLDLENDILFLNHSDVPPDAFGEFRGSHMVRDLRDVVVSGYHYHLWTTEDWARAPRPEYGGRSYQEHLGSLDVERGILLEIERLAGYAGQRRMREWDYDDPRFLEIRYENLITDEPLWFERLFRHYGFRERAIDACLRVAERHSFRNAAGRDVGSTMEGSHLRSGRPGEWRHVFTEAHKARFKELLGDLLVELGYEKDFRW